MKSMRNNPGGLCRLAVSKSLDGPNSRSRCVSCLRLQVCRGIQCLYRSCRAALGSRLSLQQGLQPSRHEGNSVGWMCFTAHASKEGAKEGHRTFQKRRLVLEAAELGPAGRRRGEVPSAILVRSRVPAAAARPAGLVPLHLDRMLQQVWDRRWRWQFAPALGDEVWHAADGLQYNAAPELPLCSRDMSAVPRLLAGIRGHSGAF